MIPYGKQISIFVHIVNQSIATLHTLSDTEKKKEKEDEKEKPKGSFILVIAWCWVLCDQNNTRRTLEIPSLKAR